MDARSPITPIAGGVRIQVQVQPRASRTELAGLHGDALKIRLAATPVDGAANEALVGFIAGLLQVARNTVVIERGLRSRRKTLLVTGTTADQVSEVLLPR